MAFTKNMKKVDNEEGKNDLRLVFPCHEDLPVIKVWAHGSSSISSGAQISFL